MSRPLAWFVKLFRRPRYWSAFCPQCGGVMRKRPAEVRFTDSTEPSPSAEHRLRP